MDYIDFSRAFVERSFYKEKHQFARASAPTHRYGGGGLGGRKMTGRDLCLGFMDQMSRCSIKDNSMIIIPNS